MVQGQMSRSTCARVRHMVMGKDIWVRVYGYGGVGTWVRQIGKGILAWVYGQWYMGMGWACEKGLMGKDILARRYGQGHILMFRIFNSPSTISGGEILVKGHLWWEGNMGKGIWAWAYRQGYMGNGIRVRAYGQGYVGNGLWARTSWLGHMGKGIS